MCAIADIFVDHLILDTSFLHDIVIQGVWWQIYVFKYDYFKK